MWDTVKHSIIGPLAGRAGTAIGMFLVGHLGAGYETMSTQVAVGATAAIMIAAELAARWYFTRSKP